MNRILHVYFVGYLDDLESWLRIMFIKLISILHLIAWVFLTSSAALKDDNLAKLFEQGKAAIYNAKEENEITRGLQLLVTASEGGYVLASAYLGNLLTNRGQAELYSPLDGLLFLHRASEQGHQRSMYDFAKLLAEFIRNKHEILSELAETELVEKLDVITPLEYLHKAYQAQNFYPLFSSPEVTKLAKDSHEMYGKYLLSLPLFGQSNLLRIWRAGSLLSSYDLQVDKLFEQLQAKITQFDALFRQDANSIHHIDLLRQIAVLATQLLENYKKDMDTLQYHIFLEHTQDIAGILAGIDDHYNAFAGRISESFAFSTYCYSQAARSEEEGACFNGAASSAISYYRRGGLFEDAERVLLAAKQHPVAATNWRTQLQTPRILHTNLTAQAWWVKPPLSQESLLSVPFRELISELNQAVVENHLLLQQSLSHLLSMPYAGLRDTRSSDLQERIVGNEGTVDNDSQKAGFRTIFTPVIGVRGSDQEAQIIQDGSTTLQRKSNVSNWAEYGPIFNGITWNKDKCDVLSPLCDVLRKPKHSQWMCSGDNAFDVERKCGTDTAVTLLRLKPGAHILPHCGTTNGRLVMHILLQGGRGVRFRAGVEWLVNYGYPPEQVPEKGAVMVFDDSFEHEVKHDGDVGDEDRLVLLVLLRHPDRV